LFETANFVPKKFFTFAVRENAGKPFQQKIEILFGQPPRMEHTGRLSLSKSFLPIRANFLFITQAFYQG